MIAALLATTVILALVGGGYALATWLGIRQTERKLRDAMSAYHARSRPQSSSDRDLNK